MKFLKKIFGKKGKKTKEYIEPTIKESPQNDIKEVKDSLPMVVSTLLDSPVKEFTVTKIIGHNNDYKEGEILKINTEDKFDNGELSIESYNEGRGIIKINYKNAIIKAKEV